MADDNVRPIRPTVTPAGTQGGVDLRGGGSDDGGMEARVAKLESDVSHIAETLRDIKTDIHLLRKEAREDFRIVCGIVIVTTIGLAGLLGKGFHWF